MSSEAAYFPDALANTTEVGEALRDAPETRPGPLGDTSELSIVGVAQFSDSTDESLLGRVRTGEKEALAQLFRRHARSVRNVAYRILRNEAEADDLVQEVFLFIFRKAVLFDPAHGAARSWIFHVAYHRAFDRRRYLNSRHFYTSQELQGTASSMAATKEEPPFRVQSMEGIFGKELTARLHSRLTLEQQETIRLFFFEGYALKEIAQLTGRSLVNVRSHYYRGLERLRKFILPEKMRSK